LISVTGHSKDYLENGGAQSGAGTGREYIQAPDSTAFPAANDIVISALVYSSEAMHIQIYLCKNGSSCEVAGFSISLIHFIVH
jgi:hypothetical protein